jgi:hypothetical protein
MKTLWRREIIQEPYLHAGLLSLCLKEANANAALRQLLIRGVPAEAYLLSLDSVAIDRGRKRFIVSQFSLHLSKSEPKVNKICDGALFYPLEDRIRVCLLDLKSHRPDVQDAIDQLENSRLFVKYAESLVAWVSPPGKPLQVDLAVVKASQGSLPSGGGFSKARVVDGVKIHSVPVLSGGKAQIGFSRLFA